MNKEIKVLPLFFILTMLILATGFYSFSQVESKIYRKNTNLIWNINERASQLSLAILLVLEGINRDYDTVSHVQQDLIKLTEQLPIDTPESIALTQSVVNLSNQIEQIKSLHAIYRNSLLFYPEANRKIQQRLKTSQANELTEQLNSLERNILLFQISSGLIYQPKLDNSTLVIKNNSVIVSLDTETKRQLDLLLKHIQIIIDYRLKRDKLFTSILNSPVTEQSHSILALYDADYQTSLSRAKTMKKGFYISALLLIISVVLGKWK